uniref:Uncharacterized protein n=1 Tax=viral metagenome TaxID=1070528 RepID=A0A6C0E319_9ZZZZ
MNAKTLFLFLILLFGLILCSFLGGRNCMTEGMTNNISSQTFTSDSGATATITDQNVLVFTDTSGFITKYVYSEDQHNQYGTTSTYTGPNGGTAVVFQGNNGVSTIQITGPNGENMTTLTQSNNTNINNNNNNQTDTETTDDSGSDPSKTNYDNYNHYDKTSYPTIFYGPNGGTARIVKTHNNNTIITTSKNGTTEIFYINNNNPNVKVATYEGRNGDTAKVITTSNGKKAVAITTKDGSKIIFTQDNAHVYNSQDQTINDTSDLNQYYSPNKEYTSYPTNSYSSNIYYNSLPQGIPKSQIPPGQEDLYILKSEVVPPVCPACPEPVVQCPDNMDPSKIPPCPPCARCPEPAFDCKKVPNYNAFNPDYMPVPVLNDFSGFGM